MSEVEYVVQVLNRDGWKDVTFGMESKENADTLLERQKQQRCGSEKWRIVKRTEEVISE